MKIHPYSGTGQRPLRSLRPHVSLLAWYRPVLPYAAIGMVLVAALATDVLRRSLTEPVFAAVTVSCGGAAIWGYARTLWLRDRADRAICGDGAAGASADLVAARVGELTERRHRHMLATGVQRMLDEIERPGSVSARLPLNRLGIAQEHCKLEHICALLDDPSVSVAPRGVAMLERLITDASSPLYGGVHPSGDRLDQRLRQVVFALEADS